ncbi:hypothetical protein M501DRAFT_1014034 [Patellaria atrata CBS 101060]|uniref:Uncharacterized protein n=1 Tax=Patellaria atrata CBS 101060 TaxID=1346257 RepID=A0A9P4VPV0_9PEZI|nr:hypothetical protein M501DRAFT_1014034 [Patellaria atrata CBS 101060]
MASAAVMLGLTPSILAVLSPTTVETSLLFIVTRRPLLALCLAAGSPATFLSRSANHADPLEALGGHHSQLSPPKLSNNGHRMVTVVEYLIAIGAIINIAWLSYELGM